MVKRLSVIATVLLAVSVLAGCRPAVIRADEQPWQTIVGIRGVHDLMVRRAGKHRIQARLADNAPLDYIYVCDEDVNPIMAGPWEAFLSDREPHGTIEPQMSRRVAFRLGEPVHQQPPLKTYALSHVYLEKTGGRWGIFITADHQAELYINRRSPWKKTPQLRGPVATVHDITPYVQKGDNEIIICVRTPGIVPEYDPATDSDVYQARIYAQAILVNSKAKVNMFGEVFDGGLASFPVTHDECTLIVGTNEGDYDIFELEVHDLETIKR